MKELLEYLQREWATLRSAPLAFVLLLILAFGAAFVAARWRYEGIVDSLKEQRDSLKERVQAKDDQLAEYRERLHLVPTTQNAYAKLTNTELQLRALTLVSQMRSFLREHETRDQFDLPANFANLTDEERQRVWREQTNANIQKSFETRSDFDSHFKVQSILLRDELLSRLPADAKNEGAYRMYEHPTNLLGMEMVTSDLERLARSLPVKNAGA